MTLKPIAILQGIWLVAALVVLIAALGACERKDIVLRPVLRDTTVVHDTVYVQRYCPPGYKCCKDGHGDD